MASGSSYRWWGRQKVEDRPSTHPLNGLRPQPVAGWAGSLRFVITTVCIRGRFAGGSRWSSCARRWLCVGIGPPFTEILLRKLHLSARARKSLKLLPQGDGVAFANHILL